MRHAIPSLRRLCFASIGVFSLSASANPAKLRVHSAEGIPDQYIVTLAGDVTIDDVARTHGVAVSKRYSHALHGFVTRMTEAQARALADDPRVELVEQDAVVRTAAVRANAAWGLDRIDQPALPLDAKYVELGDGAGVQIFVVDSGIRYSHVEFVGRTEPGAYAVDDGRFGNDCYGHGSHVAGTAAGATWGVANKARIVPVRVLGCDGLGQVSDVIDGVNWIIPNHGPNAVANFSLVVGANDMLDTAVRNLINSGVTVVAAAGNDTVDACTRSPARVREAITVGATTESDARASFSNYGPCVDINAPGANIMSAYITSDVASVVMSGTSMASPHVAGAAAAYLSAHPGATPTQVAAALLVGGTPNKLFDLMGSPNLLLNTRFVDTTPPVAAITKPAMGAIMPPSFTVEVDASDRNLDSVALAIDGRALDAAIAAPFHFELRDLPPGSHTLEVTATDLAGLQTKHGVTITVIRTAPPAPQDDELGGGCSTSSGGRALAIPLLALVALLARRRRALSCRAHEHGDDQCD